MESMPTRAGEVQRDTGDIKATSPPASTLELLKRGDNKVLSAERQKLVELALLNKRFYMVLFDECPYCGFFMFTRYERAAAEGSKRIEQRQRNGEIKRYTYDVEREEGVPEVIRECYRRLELKNGATLKETYNRLVFAAVDHYKQPRSSTILARKVLSVDEDECRNTESDTNVNELSYMDGVKDCDVPTIYAVFTTALQHMLYKVPMARREEFKGSGMMQKHPLNPRIMSMCRNFVSCVTEPKTVMSLNWPSSTFHIAYNLSPVSAKTVMATARSLPSADEAGACAKKAQRRLFSDNESPGSKAKAEVGRKRKRKLASNDGGRRPKRRRVTVSNAACPQLEMEEERINSPARSPISVQ